MSSCSSGTSRCTRMPRFILAGSKAQLEMPMKATCIIQNTLFILLWEIIVSITHTDIQHGSLSWQIFNMVHSLDKHPNGSLYWQSSTSMVHFLTNIQYGSLYWQKTWFTFWQTSNMVHFIDKKHGSLSWQTSNMVHFIDKHLAWFAFIANNQHSPLRS